MKRQPVTLKDIANATGYSVNTISRALRDKDDIAAETREKIKKVAAEMGHTHNTIASSLRLGYTNMIAVILGDISNPHFSIMMKEIENCARHHGYSSFLINTNENEEQELQAIQQALNKSVDGIIICPSQHSEANIRFLMDSGVPFVQIGRYFPELGANYVVCNDELGGYQATKYLIENGHRDILMLTGPQYISSARERLAGYRRALEEHGIPLRGELVREVNITADGCATTMKAVMDEGVQFTAIFAFSDMLAWDAWTRLIKTGHAVPESVSLVGFDNIQSRLAIPHQLSSISSYKAKMSITATECLVCHMRGEEADKKEPHCGEVCNHVIDTRLVKGETVRKLK